MEVINLDLTSSKIFPDGCVLTQGTFDGIHLGHQKLVDEVKKRAENLRLPSVMLTFKPHPAKVLRPKRRKPLLTTLDEKTQLVEELGLDYLALFAFNTELAILQADEYVRQILCGKFGARAVVVGYNHTFGRKREGNGQLLERLSPECDFEAVVVKPVLYKDEPVHSSRIRKDLIEGNFADAVHMLSRPYRIHGKVVKGRGVGRKLGFPTINVRSQDDKLIPKSGVYAAKVRVDEIWRPGMMYVGEDRTIFDFEVCIFDFEGDLYGRDVAVDVFARTRDSVRFESPDKLVAQISRDEKEIRTILK